MPVCLCRRQSETVGDKGSARCAAAAVASRTRAYRNGALELRQLILRGRGQPTGQEPWTHGCSRPSTEQSCSSFRLRVREKTKVGRCWSRPCFVDSRPAWRMLLCRYYAKFLSNYALSYQVHSRGDLSCDDLEKDTIPGRGRMRRRRARREGEGKKGRQDE